MTLENMLLENLSEWRATAPDTRTIALPGAVWSVVLKADRAEELGCRLQEMTVQRATPLELPELQDWAQQICERTVALLDELKVHEIDTQRQEALLRSATPTQREGKSLYYEVHLKSSGSANLRRYQASREERAHRDAVPFAATYETVARVIQSLTGEN
jgi:hypothetical protein